MLFRSQTFPTHDEAGFIGALDHQVIERDERRHMQVIARLGKGSIRDPAQRHRIGANRGEKAIEGSLLRLTTHRQQCADQRGQRQLAAASERFGVIGVSRKLGEFIRRNMLGQLINQ